MVRGADRGRPQVEYETAWEEDGWQAVAGNDAHGEEGSDAGCAQDFATGLKEVVTIPPQQVSVEAAANVPVQRPVR